MEKSARTIGKHKFRGLPPRRQHEILAELAGDALAKGDLAAFLPRYRQLHHWVSLDRYQPPADLSPREALEGYLTFHATQSGRPPDPPPPSLPHVPITWQGLFPVEIALDRIRSPYNFGSILRLVDNFGFRGIVHNAAWISLDHPQLKKAARGCETWIPTRYVPNLPAYFDHAQSTVVAIETDADAIPVSLWQPPPHCILLLGNEAQGIAGAIKACRQQTVRIPMRGYKKSMNVHHALAIVAQRWVECHTRVDGENGQVNSSGRRRHPR